jgi:hypothetical protein
MLKPPPATPLLEILNLQMFDSIVPDAHSVSR